MPQTQGGTLTQIVVARIVAVVVVVVVIVVALLARNSVNSRLLNNLVSNWASTGFAELPSFSGPPVA
jgi:hypothetical protein